MSEPKEFRIDSDVSCSRPMCTYSTIVPGWMQSETRCDLVPRVAVTGSSEMRTRYALTTVTKTSPEPGRGESQRQARAAALVAMVFWLLSTDTPG